MKNSILFILSLLVFFQIFASQSIAGQMTGQKLILVGGGARPDAVMKEYLAPSLSAPVVIIPWATDNAAASYTATVDALKKLGITNLVMAPVAPLTSQTKADFIKMANKASAFFFLGGDQTHIMSVLADLEIKNLLIQKYSDGYLFGGSSAGTAIMSAVMLYDGSDMTQLSANVLTTDGLGLLPANYIVDQHFLIRSRQNRLMSALLKFPGKSGLGINEDMAVIIEDNQYVRVFGPTQVVRYSPTSSARAFGIEIFSEGDSFKLFE